MQKGLLIAGGIINALLVVFHLSFWKLFNWPDSLMCLSVDNRAIMQLLNIHLAYAVAIFAVVSIWFHRAMVSTSLGRFITLAIALFYLIRAIDGLVLMPVDSLSIVVTVFLLIMAVIYVIPITVRNQTPS